MSANRTTMPPREKTASFASRLVAWADRPPPALVAGAWLHALARIVLIVIREMEANHLSLRTGALTYALILSMVPLLAMSTAVVKGLGGGDQLREITYRYIDTLEQARVTPANSGLDTGLHHPPATAAVPHDEPADNTSASLTDHLRSAANRVFDYVDRTSFATLGTFGILGVFLSVILVLSQIETAMNTIWHVTDSRSALRKIADYLTLMVLLPIALNIALAAGTLLTSDTLGVHLDRFIPLAWVQSLLLRGVPILFLTAALSVAYMFFPNTKVKSLPTLIGAFLAGTLWFTTQNLFIRLQIGVANYNAIYGSFATIPLFLVWIYFGWLFILIGAEVAFAIQHRSSYRLVRQPSMPRMQLGAAFDICATVNERFSHRRGTTIDELGTDLPFYDRDLISRTVDLLIQAGILHHSRETEVLMPSSPPQSLDHRQLIDAVFGTEQSDSPGGRASARLVAALQADPSSSPVLQDKEGESAIQAGGEASGGSAPP